MKKPVEGKLCKPMFLIVKVSIFKSSLGVSINQTKAQCLATIKKVGSQPWYLKGVEESWEEIPKINTTGATVHFLNDGSPGHFMQFSALEWNLSDLANVVHEVAHYVRNLAHDRGFEDESETQAYLSEYVFKEIVSSLET